MLWGGTAGGITGVHEWVFSETPAGVHVTTNESFAGEPVEANVTGMHSALDSSLIAWLAYLKWVAPLVRRGFVSEACEVDGAGGV